MSTKDKREFTIIDGPNSDRLSKFFHHKRRRSKKPTSPIIFRVTGKAGTDLDDVFIMMDAVDVAIVDISRKEDGSDILHLQGYCKVPLGEEHKFQENANSSVIYTKELVDACFSAFYNPKTKDGNIVLLI